MRVLITVVILLFINCSFGQKKVNGPIKQIPDVQLYNLNGDTFNLLTLSKNKITFIDFWFVPCGPCFLEMNLLHKLYNKYKDNPNISFLTITFTDSAFIRPLTENRNVANNQTYNYFKSLSKIDTFRLPVYFMRNAIVKQNSFIESEIGFKGKSEGIPKDKSLFPSNIFQFSYYPTVLIYDKNGQLIYFNSGFTSSGEAKQKKQIESIIEKYSN
jgi:thiol-disulfide isomerase/thioredoxin